MLIIDELGRCLTRSGNSYIANNEQVWLAVLFCTCGTLIRFKLYYN